MNLSRTLLDLATRTASDTAAGAEAIARLCRRKSLAIEEVIEAAEGLVLEHPAAAGELARAITRISEEPDGPQDVAAADRVTTMARAVLLEGQVRAIEGDFPAALTLVDRAHGLFQAAGDPWRALRTALGRIHILNELGRSTDGVETGTDMLARLDRLVQDASAPAAPFEPAWLRASFLTNIAICHTFAGDYARAEAANDAAERELIDLGRWDELAILRQNQAEQLLEVGQVHRARDIFERAAKGFAGIGLTLLEARCLADPGRAHSLLGNYRDALTALSRAESLLLGLDLPADLLQVRLRHAEALLGLNLYAQAARIYGEVLDGVAAAGQVHYQAVSLAGRGAARAALGRLPGARADLERAAELHDGTGNLPLAAIARVELAAVLARDGDRPAACALLRRVRDDTAGPDHRVARAYAQLGLSDLSEPAEAERALADAALICDILALPPLRFRTDSRLGALRRRQGRIVEARELLERAAGGAERQRALLPSELMRTSFLRDKVRAFDELVGLELDAGDPEAAFRAVERARCRSLLDLVQRDAGDVPTDASMPTEREHDLIGELGALYDEQMAMGPATPAHQPGPPTRHALRQRVEELEARLALHRLEVPADEGIGIGRYASHATLRRHLGRDALLIAFCDVDGRMVRFTSRGQELNVADVAPADQVRQLAARLNEHWRSFRAGPDFVARHEKRLRRACRGDLRALADALLAGLDLSPPATGGRMAVVSPHGLQRIPFHILPLDDGRPLLAEWEITTTPSGSLLVGLAPWRLDRTRPAVAVAPRDPTIPHAAAEVHGLSELLAGLHTYVGPQATRATVRDQAARAGILHLACHGLFRPQDGYSSALRLEDGWLSAAELSRLPLREALVVLSGCETGRAEQVGGEPVGLEWALLAAGASAVVSSLWMADDRATSALMQDFYTHLLRGESPSAALRTAQLARADEHPYYWAPFTVTAAV